VRGVKNLVRALLALSAVTVALFATQSFKVWRVVRRQFAPIREIIKPGEGPVLVTSRVLETASGARIGAFWVPPKSGAVVLLLHGTEANRLQLWSELQLLAQNGYGVLAIDWPGMGESDGTMVVGKPEREAFDAAIELISRVPEVNIGVLGFSQGAALAVQYAAEEPRVKSVLAVGAFTDALEQTGYEFRHGGVFTKWPAVFFTSRYMETGNIRPIDVAAKLKGRASLFVCGTKDDMVPPQMAEDLARATGGELWRIEGAGHVDFRNFAKDEWPRRVLAFFAPLAVAPPAPE
jgi:pimeloyl-ACP methyl ester carboxylesterase